MLSPDFAPSAPRIEGENAMREPNVMCGYSRDADETAAAVKLREVARVGPEALPDLCEVRLGAFRSPDIVHILPDLPKGPSGRIQRVRLAQMIE